MVILPMSRDAKADLIKATQEDTHLQMLIKVITNGFPVKATDLPDEIRHYFNFKEELSHLNGLIFKGDKIVVPKSEEPSLLKSIHQGHFVKQS